MKTVNYMVRLLIRSKSGPNLKSQNTRPHHSCFMRIRRKEHLNCLNVVAMRDAVYTYSERIEYGKNF